MTLSRPTISRFAAGSGGMTGGRTGTASAPRPARRTQAEPDARVALVTGGARGLGAAIAESFLSGGMSVVIADVMADAAEERAKALDPEGRHALGIRLDVRDDESARAAVGAAIARFGRLDVLVNNAGTDETAPFDEIRPEVFDRVIDVNLRGPVNMSRAALPALRASNRGTIVNIVSTAAKRAWPNASAYHASKWGLLGFSHALHTEARQYGVRVTAVIAGGMRTPFLLDRFPDLDPETLQDPASVAETIRCLVEADHASVVPEITILPMQESSWP